MSDWSETIANSLSILKYPSCCDYEDYTSYRTMTNADEKYMTSVYSEYFLQFLSLLETMEDNFYSFYEWILNTVRLTAELAETLLSCTCFEFSMILEANCVSCSEANWSQAQELMILDLFFFSCPIRCRLQLPRSKRYAHCTYQSMT